MCNLWSPGEPLICYCENCGTHIKIALLKQPELLPRGRELKHHKAGCPTVVSCEYCPKEAGNDKKLEDITGKDESGEVES